MPDDYEDVGLSEEERAALKEEDESGEADDAGAEDSGSDSADDGADAPDDDDDDDDDDGADDQDDADKEASGGDKADDADGGKADNASEEPPPAKDEKKDAREDQKPPEDPVKVLEGQLGALREQFDKGELSVEEYIDQRAKVEREIVRVEMSREYSRQKVEDAWRDAQVTFFDKNAYLKDNDVLYGAFAAQVNKILQSPEGQNMTDAAVLEKAKEAVDAAFGRKEEPKPEKDTTKPDPVKEAKKAAADRSKIPQTLKGVPPAEAADTGGKYAYLDKLTGEAYEEALSKLSASELEAYANEK